MDCTLTCDLEPLDFEVMERVVEGVSDMIKTGCDLVDLESDEELELALRRELAEMVRANGVSDPDVLLDMVIEGIVESGSEA